MSPPIKPGTARRLGLRPPPSLGMLLYGREVGPEVEQKAIEAMDAWARKMMASDRPVPVVEVRGDDQGQVDADAHPDEPQLR